MPIGKFRVINLIVIEDPEDPDPARRFKMAFQTRKYQSRVAVAFSPDGLRWKEFEGNPVSKHMSEIHGLIKYNGVYYVNGHGGSPRTGPNEIMPRRMITFMSYDFEHWAEATALSFERHGGEIPQPWRGHSGEQVHTGASLWNRGNVIIGFYGQWHGHPSDDRRMVTMDLGMIVEQRRPPLQGAGSRLQDHRRQRGGRDRHPHLLLRDSAEPAVARCSVSR